MEMVKVVNHFPMTFDLFEQRLRWYSRTEAPR
jgi:hypothetical protein